MAPAPVVGIPGNFSIRDVQSILSGTDLFHPLHKHDFHFMLVIKQGNGIHEIDFETITVTDRSLFFLRPGQVHQLELRSDCQGFLVEFDNMLIPTAQGTTNRQLRKAASQNVYRLAIHPFERLWSRFQSIYKEHKSRTDGFEAVIRAEFEIIIIELIRQRAANSAINESKPNAYAQERLEEFSELLQRHFHQMKLVAQYAERMHLSAFQLNSICRSQLGKTASLLIDEHIILEAKRNLQATTSQVKEIADQLGYEDVSYFIRFFKKHTGFSPEAFRRMRT